jgi:excisionase family DNA binding protein
MSSFFVEHKFLNTLQMKQQKNNLPEGFKQLIKDLAKQNSADELLTTEELCSFLKISRVTLWTLRKKNHIPYIRVGLQIRYQKPEVINSLLKNKELKSINYGE